MRKVPPSVAIAGPRPAIDGVAQTERWIGGSAPSDGGSAGVDIHTFTIIKTADATFTVIGNHSKTS